MVTWGALGTPLARVLAALVAVAGALVVSACSTPSPQGTPTPSPTAVFASEEEALAAASDAYAKYNAAFDVALSQGGTALEDVEQYVTADYLEQLRVPGALTQNGWHTFGTSSFDSIQLLERPSDKDANVAVRLCRDVSQVRILNDSNEDVTPPDRDDRFPLVVYFEEGPGHPTELVVSGTEPWSGEDFC